MRTMPYKFENYGNETFDDQIEDSLNREERAGWKVVQVLKYDSGHMKVLLHRDAI